MIDNIIRFIDDNLNSIGICAVIVIGVIAILTNTNDDYDKDDDGYAI